MAETRPELLARHYEGAGRISEAIAGWMRAGYQAQQRSALRECAAYLQKAISLLETLPPNDPARLKSEMEAQLALAVALMSTIGWGSREAEAACIRARDLCEKLGNGPGLIGALWGLWTVYFLRGTLVPCLGAAEQVLKLALAAGDPGLEIAARQAIGYSNYFLGNFVEAREHAEKGLALYDPERERSLVASFQLPLSSACGNFKMMSLWFMGYPEQAEQARKEAWAMIVALDNPACTVYAQACAMMIDFARRDYAAAREYAESLHAMATEGGFLLWAAQGRIYRGWTQAMTENPEAGIAEMRAGLESYRFTGSDLMTPQFCIMMAEAQVRAGRPGEALASVSRGLHYVEDSQEHVHEPELHRLRGEILISQGASSAGETSLMRAIEIAQSQQAKMLELRAALVLARLYRDRGRTAEAAALLQPLHDWFQEGRNLPELAEARSILESTSSTA
jgi:predicted ATPase